MVDELHEGLRREKDATERLWRTHTAAEPLLAGLAEERRRLVEHHAMDFSTSELDAEVGCKTLVSIAGGGGGSGYVYIGAYQRLQEAGLVPGYVIGASIGALLGLFCARRAAADWNDYLSLAKSLEAKQIFTPVSISRRYGFPGLLRLRLRSAIGRLFTAEDGTPLRISDLDIPYEAVVGGIRRRSFEDLALGLFDPATESAAPGLMQRIGGRMWKVTAFFDPRIVKAVVLGADSLTAAVAATDAAGFSAAIPGVLHYDIEDGDEAMEGLLASLFEREEIGALIDGGVVSNVPAELAWKRVQAGKIGTRNALYLAFDCFHPQWDPAHLWLQPITQALQLQMTVNAPYAHWIVRFEPTLSPLTLLPSPDVLDEAAGWGRQTVDRVLPLLHKFLEPLAWSD